MAVCLIRKKHYTITKGQSFKRLVILVAFGVANLSDVLKDLLAT